MEAIDITAGCYLFDECGGCEAVGFAGHDENGFDVGDGAVSEGELEFKVEVGDVTEATKDGGCADLFGKVDGEAGVGLKLDDRGIELLVDEGLDDV